MDDKFFQQFRDPVRCLELLRRLKDELTGELRFMEVCGTHTVAIFQSGLRSLLPENVVHLSGPGCPVCVTHEAEVNAFLDLAGKPGVILTTFGDLMRVPGQGGRNLKTAQAEGARVAVVYSPIDALALARKHPDDTVVFLGVGFETTAPTVAGTVLMAKEQCIDNFKVLSFHKLVPPALEVLLADDGARIDAFLLPGHVSTIIGIEPYRFIASRFGKPAVITGFEPMDILGSLLFLAHCQREGRVEVKNCYRRAVADEGNKHARDIMYQVFRPSDALWRGIGSIPASGLELADAFEAFDAKKQFDLHIEECPPLPGCKCGEVLRGRLRPDQCPLFKVVCTPSHPVGPCMVSTEGSCAAYYKYQVE